MKKIVFCLLFGLIFSVTTDATDTATLDVLVETFIDTNNVVTFDSFPVPLEQLSNNVEQILNSDVPLFNPSSTKENVISDFDEDDSEQAGFLPKVNTSIKTDIAIMIDCNSGDVLFEKNADKYWSAASLSKVFLLYLIMEKVEKGEINLDEYVDIENEEWLGNMPADATTMHLEKGQRVTYRQLIQGLSIVSANDAAYLFVNKIFGGKDNYSKIINEVLARHGFNQLHVEEPSGISSFNRITARQFASFCSLYIDKNSKMLDEVHSLKYFTYPLKENLVEGKKYKYKDSVTRNNTNTLIGQYDGVDGLKTGFLSISGFNIVATAKRNGKRLLVVLLGSKSSKGASGKATLIEDAKKLFDKGFELLAK